MYLCLLFNYIWDRASFQNLQAEKIYKKYFKKINKGHKIFFSKFLANKVEGQQT